MFSGLKRLGAVYMVSDNTFGNCDSADFHDYHHRLLYTKSGNYSSTFTYMDW